jgi:hypothetical protein
MSFKLSCAVMAKAPDDGALQRAIASIRPHVDEVCLLWTCKEGEERPRLEGVDVVGFSDVCNAQQDCPPESACQCKAGDITDFAAARNASWALTTGGLVTYVDSDDLVVASPGANLRQLYKENVRTLYPYDYTHDSSGTCVARHHVDRVVAKATSFWTDPVHNMLTFPSGMSLEKTDAVRWVHQRGNTGAAHSTARALRILRHWEGSAKYANDARFAYYLGRVHLDAGLRGRASVELERAYHLQTHVDHKTLIALDLARCWAPAPKYALEWGHRALELRPEWPAPWLTLARLYRALASSGAEPRKNAKLAHQFLRGGLACDDADTMVFTDPTERVWTSRLILGTDLRVSPPAAAREATQ